MDMTFLGIGRLKGPEQELCDRYFKRIKGMGRSLGVGRCALSVVNEARGNGADARKALEASALLAKTADRAVLIALDERGRSLSSQDFAALFVTLRDRGAPELVFALGGPDGHGEAVLQKAQVRLSLSAMTLPHGLARVVLFEQVYRAMTIIANHPYHRQ